MRFLVVIFLSVAALGFGFFLSNTASYAVEGTLDVKGPDLQASKPADYPVATFAGGCFWCVESEFRPLMGVLFTRSGYIGGQSEHPTYQDITTGETGHAEAVEITFDPEKISYSDLVDHFLRKAHDPTQLNRQGVDVGTQYRSEIFYHDEAQREIAANALSQLKSEGVAVVTKLSPAPVFWEAEAYHQQYYEKYEEESGAVHPRVLYKKQMKLLKGQ